MRVALLSYRSKPHCGGQGVYVRHLSRELVRLGHEVEVFSGQPYPELDEGVRLTKVPSLDLYREPDPFRIPRPSRVPRPDRRRRRSRSMWTAGFPEPRTFSTRVLRLLRERAGDFDVVHDNQALGRPCSTSRARRAAAGRHDPPPDHHRPPDRPRRRRRPGASGSPCAAGTASCGCRPGSPAACGIVLVPSESSQPRRRPRVRRRPEPDARRAARRRRRVRPADRAPRPRPDPGDGQRRRPDEGHRDAARGLRQAPHRALRRSSCCWSPSRRPAAAPSGCSTSSASRDHVRFVHGVSDAELVALMGSAEVACVPEPLRGLLAARPPS